MSTVNDSLTNYAQHFSIVSYYLLKYFTMVVTKEKNIDYDFCRFRINPRRRNNNRTVCWKIRVQCRKRRTALRSIRFPKKGLFNRYSGKTITSFKAWFERSLKILPSVGLNNMDLYTHVYNNNARRRAQYTSRWPGVRHVLA